MRSSPPDPVVLTPAARQAVLRHAAAAAPAECCGMLFGHAEPGRASSIVTARPAANLAPETARRFRIAPAAMAAESARARAQGLDLIGFYHSHPVGPARPSAADVAEASGWPGYLHLIAAENDPARVRVFTTAPDAWTENPFV